MNAAPALFVSHGSPMFALEPGTLGPKLMTLGEALRESLAAILIVSAHWQTRELRVMATPSPQTMHDFGGFPDELYQIQYPARGAPELAESARLLLGDRAVLDDRRGLDHGAWVPLRYLAPDGSTPVLQVSLRQDLNSQAAIRLGNALAPLRARGVMIVGSGSLTHNLHEYFRGRTDTEYALDFVRWIRAALERRDIPRLLDYRLQAPNARRAHPTEEHFLPLLVALGASSGTDQFSVLEGGMDRALSMDSFLWASSPDSAHA
jgi:4,5-DOPA dioxygenase extradiol